MALNKQRASLIFGVLAMIGLVVGTFLQGGSLAQKLLFLIGAIALTVLAYLNKLKMFMVIEIVVSLSAILAFVNMAMQLKYLILIGASIVGVGYLIKINFFKEDKWWPIGGLGLLLIAAGLATDATAYPFLFNLFLGLGGIFVAIYSAIGFFLLKVKIALIWLILNIFFSISPMMAVFSKLLG